LLDAGIEVIGYRLIACSVRPWRGRNIDRARGNLRVHYSILRVAKMRWRRKPEPQKRSAFMEAKWGNVLNRRRKDDRAQNETDRSREVANFNSFRIDGQW
jgi:hypothetical protein